MLFSSLLYRGSIYWLQNNFSIMANTLQKIVLLDINANTLSLIEAKLSDGYYIHKVINLQPSVNKLLIIYTLPEWF